jgi:DNA polymerase III delta prime subunit
MNITDEIIEKYLAGESLDADILQAIDAKFRSDEAFTDEVAMKISENEPDAAILRAIKKVSEVNKKKKILAQVNLAATELDAEGFFKEQVGTPQLTISHRRTPMQMILAIAAVMIAVVVGYNYIMRDTFKPTDGQMATWFPTYSSDKISDEIRNQLEKSAFSGNDAYKMLLSALEKYHNQDFAGAKTLLEQLVKQNSEMPEPPFFLAMCQMKTGDFVNAKSGFEKIQTGEFADAARFHLAEVLIKTGDKKEARILLSKVAGKQGEFQNAAKNILDNWK